jgi:chemotaxis protein histidine kinase CheA
MEAALLVIDEHRQSYEPLETVFRLAHSLKGTAASVGLEHIAGFTHGLENLVERLRERTLALDDRSISRLFEAVDALREMLADGPRHERAAPGACPVARGARPPRAPLTRLDPLRPFQAFAHRGLRPHLVHRCV